MEYIKRDCYNDEKLKYIAMLDMNLEELDKIREDEVVMNYKSELERMNENEEFQRYMSVEKMNEMDRNTSLYEAREEGLKQGINQGLTQGRESEKREVINNLNKMNLNIDVIAGAVKLPIDDVLKILSSN